MFGTLTTFDTLETRFQYANERLADIGEAEAYRGISQLLDDHNAIMRVITSEFAAWTTERDAMYGGGDTSAMTEVAEVGTAPPSKVIAGSVVGFPLRRYERAWQGTKKFLQRATLGEVLGQVNAMRDSDRINMIRQLKIALFNPTNYTFVDYLTDHRTNPVISVKALVNADGMPIPPGPNGEFFDPTTHTHFLGTASFALSDLVALKQTVMEHYASGTFALSIPTGLESTVRGFTPNFVATLPGGQVGPTTAIQIPGIPLQLTPTANRLIGEFDGVPVWVRPWMPAGYVVMTNLAVRTLNIRVEAGLQGAGDLQIDAQDEDHPLRADTYSREFGVGVRERTGSAILFTGNSSYSAPSL